MLRYSETHTWARPNGTKARIGISDAAREELGEIVHAELPAIGTTVQAEEELAVLESTKAAVDIYSPISGKVTAVNEKAVDVINQSCEDRGWLVELEVTHPAELEELLDPDGYLALLTPAL
jgi:glycine cleavage system H protein